MIPSIEEIIAGLLAGQFTKEQAQHWIALHMELDAEPDDGSNEYPPLGLAVPTGEGDVTWDFPILHFGYGAIEVGDAVWQGLPALCFSRDGQGLGVERERNEPAKEGETLMLFTFKNIEGLEAIEAAVSRVRAKLEARG